MQEHPQDCAELVQELEVLRQRVAAFQELERHYQQSLNTMKLLKKALETTQMGVTISDAAGKIMFTNPAEAEMHGFEVEELIGQDVRIFSPSKLWNPAQPLQIKHFSKFKRESENVRKDGTVFPVQIMSDVVLDEAGEPLGVVTCCEDISERRQLEQVRVQAEVAEARTKAVEATNRELEALYAKEQAVTRTLQDLNQMKTNFLVVISHEMRTPLAILKGYNDLLLEDSDSLGAEAVSFLKVSQKMTERLTVSFDNILEMLKLNHGQRVLHSVTYDLCQLAKNVTDTVSRFVKRRQQVFEVVCPPHIFVSGDAEKMELVIFNLLQNAIKFTPDGGTIRLQLELRGSEAHVVVSDTGIGIDSGELERVFEPFFTHPDPGQHSSGHFEFGTRGIGLGLAVAKGYVEAHRGKIWAESGGEGTGSRFHILLPLHARSRKIAAVTLEPIPTL
ncbi:MAG: PAS domain-containing sensor histidine kinase [Blastocatellia bacterium]|nr:PAS domain-containing sensor histidine kinase [Blastocatellia bacterium]